MIILKHQFFLVVKKIKCQALVHVIFGMLRLQPQQKINISQGPPKALDHILQSGIRFYRGIRTKPRFGGLGYSATPRKFVIFAKVT